MKQLLPFDPLILCDQRPAHDSSDPWVSRLKPRRILLSTTRLLQLKRGTLSLVSPVIYAGWCATDERAVPGKACRDSEISFQSSPLSHHGIGCFRSFQTREQNCMWEVCSLDKSNMARVIFACLLALIAIATSVDAKARGTKPTQITNKVYPARNLLTSRHSGSPQINVILIIWAASGDSIRSQVTSFCRFTLTSR